MVIGSYEATLSHHGGIYQYLTDSAGIDTPEEDPKIAEAREMKAFLETHTQDETAQHFNCSRQTVVNRMKLLVERNEG